MSEIKRNIKENADGSFTITDEHSTADIVRWLLTQDSKETILYLLKEEAPQRTWVGLTDEEIKPCWYEACQTDLELTSQLVVYFAKAIEAKLKEKNT